MPPGPVDIGLGGLPSDDPYALTFRRPIQDQTVGRAATVDMRSIIRRARKEADPFVAKSLLQVYARACLQLRLRALADGPIACAGPQATMPNQVDTSSSSQPSSTAFGILQRELDKRTSVTSIEGELDLSTAPRLKWMLTDSREAGHSRLVVDLSLATFIDSTALGVLVGVQRSLAVGAQLAIVCTRPAMLQIFEFSGLDAAFAIFPTLDEALAFARGNTAQGC
jgi:anti-sigma B factor antagonist